MKLNINKWSDFKKITIIFCIWGIFLLAIGMFYDNGYRSENLHVNERSYYEK